MSGSGDTPGAVYLGEGRCRFCVWAPLVHKVEIRLISPGERTAVLEKDSRGCHRAELDDVGPGSLYFFRLDGDRERPDPASRFQPRGVHGPSQVVDPAFAWSDQTWFGLPIQQYILYELHVGTFTERGTFDAIIPRLDYLKTLGVTALELMPVAQFPGDRNWGYDGVCPFAVQNSYGGPEGLKRLVNACHEKGLAVVLDVVYNHLGPEGNYLRDFAPYFTDQYSSPWGEAVNFDGCGSDGVRRFFIENALSWVIEFHVDALRLDAVHAILDFSAEPFLKQLADEVHERGDQLNRRAYLIPESALNDPRLIRSPELGGLGMDAQWNDDFHHALHTVLTGERKGYYQDFGGFHQLVKAFREGFVFTGEYSSYRRRKHGSSSRDIPAGRFVVFSQNHDQVGNRLKGDRLTELVSFEELKLAAASVLLSPFVPLLFMGEEYGETAPFPYFVSHSDPDLVDAVRRGRREEFAEFAWKGDPPDPQDEKTFQSAKLNRPGSPEEPQSKAMYRFYRELIRLRKSVPALSRLSKDEMETLGFNEERILLLKRRHRESRAAVIFHYGGEPVSVRFPLADGMWKKALDSGEEKWGGPGSSVPARLQSDGGVRLTLSPLSVLLFVTQEAC